MSLFVFKLPDLGEGTVEAELLAWHVKPGDQVAEDQIIAEVMTDKAAVELPSPVTGRVLSTTGQAGDKVRVGAELISFETGTAENPTQYPQPPGGTETRTNTRGSVVSLTAASAMPVAPLVVLPRSHDCSMWLSMRVFAPRAPEARVAVADFSISAQ